MMNKEHYTIGLTIKPLYSQVVIIRDEDSGEHLSRGGVLLKGDAAPKQVTGIVVAAGAGRITADGSLKPLLLSVGDKVRYRENFGDTFHLEGFEFHALQEMDVICTLPKPDEDWED